MCRDVNCNIERLSAIVAPIAKKYAVVRMCLFGSRARGDNTDDSDYDFCIIPDDDMTLIDLSNFVLDLKETLKANVDVVCEDSINLDFASSIKKDEIVIYEI